jgi:hypothetical protein
MVNTTSQVNHGPQELADLKNGLRVALLSATPGTGKSTLAALFQALYGARIFSIASSGQDAGQFKARIDARFCSDETYTLFPQLACCRDNVIVDVGGAGSELFLNKMLSTRLLDYFNALVFVVDRTSRSQEDTQSCLEMLKTEGLRDEQIKILLNWKKPRESVQSQFETILAYGAQQPGVDINPICVTPEMRFFEIARKSGMTFAEAFSHRDDRPVTARTTNTIDASSMT